MPSIFRVHDWSLSTKFLTGALTTAAVPPLMMGALGMFQATPAGFTTDRLLYLASAVCAAGLACTTFSVFAQQASRISGLIAKLTMQAARPSGESADSPQGQGGTSSAPEKTLALLQTQTEHLASSVATMDGLTASIERVAEHVALSVTAAEQTLTNAQHGVTAVQSTAQESQHLQLMLKDTAKRVQHLEAHVQEVEAIGAGIADLADRTSVLALNVSVQAAKTAGGVPEAAMEASEVEHLAGRTADATRRIAHLVHTIQRDTSDVVSALETHTQTLAQWAEHTGQASQALGQVEHLAGQLTELIQAISQAVAQQASSSATLSKTMGEISTVTQQTAAGTKHMATSMNNLTQLVGALRSSVSGQRQAA